MQVFSNNPLIPNTTTEAIYEHLNPQKSTDANFFCRTYNYPFNAENWFSQLKVITDKGEHESLIFYGYTSTYLEQCEDKNNLYYSTKTSDLWKQLDEEIGKQNQLELLLLKIKPIKEGFIQRCRLKWGGDYTFEDFLHLENLFNSTLKANEIESPLQIDSIKKACKISCSLDRAIVAADSKEIKELSKAYADFVKAANIDNIIEAQSKDVIGSVAQLADYLESKGFEYNFYDNVSRDVVDKTIKDMKQYLVTLVKESSNLDATLELIANSYLQKKEEDEFAEATDEKPLDELIGTLKSGANDKLDEELSKEDVDADLGLELGFDE